jgi:hypothetical protein
MPLPTDTSSDSQRFLTDVHRHMSLGRKWHLLGETFSVARSLHAAGIRMRQPDVTSASIRQQWLTTQFGYDGRGNVAGTAMTEVNQNLTVLCDVMRVFTELEIPHALGGSMASSLYGMARFTRDADMTVEPFAGKEEAFAAALGPNYYLSLPAIRQAVCQRSSFNVIQTLEGFKVDVFVRKDEPFEMSAVGRRVTLNVPGIPAQVLTVLTAEDVVLFKLRWYRMGDEVSEQQWNDVLGVLRVQAGKLDAGYLEHWAASVGVADLLARARTEAATVS